MKARKFIFWVFFGALLLSSSRAQKEKNPDNHFNSLVNGQDVPKGRFPYICSLRDEISQNYFCTGTLVALDWILAAAHCIQTQNASNTSPIVYCEPEGNTTESSEIFYVIETKVHESWNGDPVDGYDIALLKLDRKANSTLPNLSAIVETVSSGTELIALDWRDDDANKLTDSLQMFVDLTFVSRDRCENLLGRDLEEHQFCAGFFTQSCQGDSGGPLLIPDWPKKEIRKGLPNLDLIVGVPSYGSDVCDGTLPAVYTNTGFFLEWIKDHLENEEVQEITERRMIFDPSIDMEEVFDIDNELGEASASTMSEENELFEKEIERLIRAIHMDDASTVEFILLEGVDPDSVYETETVNRGKFGDALLHWACRYDAKESAKVLFDYGANVTKKNDQYETPLHHCGEFGSNPVTKALLDNGADIEAKDIDGWTPLFEASRTGKLSTVELLLTEGADIDAGDNNNYTALHWEIEWGHMNIINLLIDQGANVDATDKFEWTSLHWAAYYGKIDIVNILLDGGGSKKAKNSDGKTPFDVVCKYYKARCSRSKQMSLRDLLSF